MRMYLSSYQMGTAAEALHALLRGASRAAVIANALDPYPDQAGRRSRVERQQRNLARLGVESEALDLREYFGRPQALAARLEPVDLLWVHGGNSFVLKRAFEQSGCDAILSRRLAEDSLVYGGFSAALMMVTPTMRGIELCDDPVTVPAGYATGFSWDSLGLAPYSIAPHYRSEHPEAEMMEAVVRYFEAHGMPYRTLRDGEAIVIDEAGDRVVGSPAVLWGQPDP